MAERLGFSVRELLAKCDARELSEWQVYTRLDDWKSYIAQKQLNPDEKTKQLKHALFGRAIAYEKQLEKQKAK